MYVVKVGLLRTRVMLVFRDRVMSGESDVRRANALYVCLQRGPELGHAS